MRDGRPPRIFVSAGEPSGDLHGARVVAALRARFPGAEIEAFGGPAMAAAGARVRFRMEAFSVVGIAEAVTAIPAHLRLLRRLRGEFAAGRYDLLVVIDYPGFHLRLAAAARSAGVRVLYYIAPQLWAWRPGRARRLAAAVDRLAVVLPFEPGFFAGLGVPAEFVGHPLADEANRPSRAEARERLGVAPGQRVLALFPGSRRTEVRRHWAPFRAAATRLLRAGRCDRVLVATTPAGAYPDAGALELVPGDPLPVLAAADAAIAKSGTTTLEAALADTPMVVAYRTHPVTFALVRRMLTVQWVSLVNLVAERAVVPELLQDAATPDRLVEAAGALLDPAGDAARRQREGLALVRERLGRPGAAGRLADMAAELLEWP